MEAINSKLPALTIKDDLEAAIFQAKQIFPTETQDIQPDLPPAQALRKLQEQLTAADLWTNVACNRAAAKGHLALLQWLISTHPACLLEPIECAVIAAERQQTDILDWLRMQYPSDFSSDRACSCAAAWGRLDALKAFRAVRLPLPWSTETAFAAAAFARQDVLDFLRSETPPCPWDAEATRAAAGAGHMEILQFLIAKGCPCKPDAVSTAVRQGQYEVADWLLGHRQNIGPDVFDIWTAAVYYASLPMLDFLGDRDLFKVLAPNELVITVVLGDLVVVKHMIKHWTALKLMALVLCQAIKGTTCQGRMTHARDPVYRNIWSARRKREPDVAGPQHDELLQVVYEEMPNVHNPYEIERLFEVSADLHSISLVEMAAKSGGEPKLMWDADMHGLAAAKGDLALLRWLVDCPVDQSYKVVGSACSNARMMLLVHGYGWQVLVFYKSQLAKAEACHWAFYGAVRRHRNAVPSGETTLGSLPDALLKNIACAADIDFCWGCSK